MGKNEKVGGSEPIGCFGHIEGMVLQRDEFKMAAQNGGGGCVCVCGGGMMGIQILNGLKTSKTALNHITPGIIYPPIVFWI